ncbi:PilZ domain-containing protein [Photobacterium lipolyticum]|uniref:PilZ domain-containing protein n=1 Tax=Photobacterium lipolyticum TaxID=266810 RepID=A0A2T3N491_9GAMM|nr:PilZ domain-containing protein [Photobacterium lipolyticum]PSW07286.1 PilZ domain-containing protein [Photobacterium lipolyticum]
MNQDEYFSVNTGLTINVEPLGGDEHLPDELDFIKEIPPLFRVASECSGLEESADRSLAGFGKDESKALLAYLAAQNSKINLLLSFVLSQQDDPAIRYTTETFGASKLTYLSGTPFIVGNSVRVKLFLDHPPAAIYCYAEVSNCEAKDDKFEVTLRYNRLQEEDRDLLIRAALNIQQKLLRQRAQQRTDA